MMTSKSTIAILAILSTSCLFADDEKGFRPLFNGKNLDGWVLVNTAPATWTVKDNMLICSGKPIGEIRTNRMYQNFIMEVEWRHMVPKGNAGIFVWADDITARGVPFHRSIEVQVLENAYGNTRGYTTHGDIFPIHGAKMTPINGRGGSRAFPTENRSNPSPEWNHYRITCIDGTISLAVNGKVVTKGKECNPRKGYICLESEGGIVHYRNMKIKELPGAPVEDRYTAIANRGFRTLYTGLDLSGWVAVKDSGWQPSDWVLKYSPKGDADGTLTTKTEFSDFGFVFDYRHDAKSEPATVLLRGKSIVLELDNENGVLAKHLPKPGGWVRIEGTLKGNQLTLSVNGKRVLNGKRMKDAAESGPISISPKGAIQFANLYARDIKD